MKRIKIVLALILPILLRGVLDYYMNNASPAFYLRVVGRNTLGAESEPEMEKMREEIARRLNVSFESVLLEGTGSEFLRDENGRMIQDVNLKLHLQQQWGSGCYLPLKVRFDSPTHYVFPDLDEYISKFYNDMALTERVENLFASNGFTHEPDSNYRYPPGLWYHTSNNMRCFAEESVDSSGKVLCNLYISIEEDVNEKEMLSILKQSDLWNESDEVQLQLLRVRYNEVFSDNLEFLSCFNSSYTDRITIGDYMTTSTYQVQKMYAEEIGNRKTFRIK